MTKHKWFLISGLIAVALLAAAIGANVFAIAAIYRSGFQQAVAGLMCLTSGYAIYYILTGATKSRSVGYFQSFMVMFALCEILLMAEMRQYLYWLIPCVLSFSCLTAVAVAKDLGKVKSVILASVLTACQVFMFVVSIVTWRSSHDYRPAMGMFLGLVMLLLIFAKYQDKADRAAEIQMPVEETKQEENV